MIFYPISHVPLANFSRSTLPCRPILVNRSLNTIQYYCLSLSLGKERSTVRGSVDENTLWPWPGLEPGLLYPEYTALNITPACLLLTRQWYPMCQNLNSESFKTLTDDSFKGASSRFAHVERCSLQFSSSSFIIHVNLLNPWSSLFLYRSLLYNTLLFFYHRNFYFQVSFNLKVILYVAKIIQNIVTELL